MLRLLRIALLDVTIILTTYINNLSLYIQKPFLLKGVYPSQVRFLKDNKEFLIFAFDFQKNIYIFLKQ